MKRLLCVVFLTVTLFQCSKEKPADIFLSKEYVDMRGREAITIIKNGTSDTLKLTGSFFTYIPYKEKIFDLELAPGEEDSLVFSFIYPDFIHVHSRGIRIFNAPGNTVKAEINPTGINFEGSLASINNYYQAYHKHFGSFDQEHAPYYAIGGKLNDMNRFPALADSVNNVSMAFLETYDQSLPDWFKTHESWRMKYNAAFRKYNVPFSKGYYSGSTQQLDSSFYDFDRSTPLSNHEVILNTEYIQYVMFRIFRNSSDLKNDKEKGDAMITTIDRMVEDPKVADVLKLKRMLDLYEQSKSDYRNAIDNLAFTDSTRATLLDSLVIVKSGRPLDGHPVPEIELVDLDGNHVALADFAGKHVIVNFWASWCGPCIEEFAHESKLHEQYKDKGLVVVNVCVRTNQVTWRKISATKKMSMINLYSPTINFEDVKNHFDLNAMPRSILVSPSMDVIDNYFPRASRLNDRGINEILSRVK